MSNPQIPAQTLSHLRLNGTISTITLPNPRSGNTLNYWTKLTKQP